ncbi:MAG: hypothetical protein RLZZ304_332, partial [Actinomycetota bacterium]
EIGSISGIGPVLAQQIFEEVAKD